MEILEEQVYCSNCGGKRNHQIIHEETVTSGIYHEYNLKDDESYYIVSCLGCDTYSFAQRFVDVELINADPLQINVIDRYFSVPDEYTIKDIEETHFTKLFSNVPYEIENLYRQVVSVYNQKYDILCAAGIRTLIEAICLHLNIQFGYIYEDKGVVKVSKKDNLVSSNSLEGKIFGLYEAGYIIWGQCLILQKIREFSNSAVHEIKSPPLDDLHSAIGILENVIENVYELKAHKLLKKD